MNKIETIVDVMTGETTVVETPYTEEELANIDEQIRANTRLYRDQLLQELDSLVCNPLRWAEFSDTLKADLATYRQDLLNVPQQEGFPSAIIWPVKPE